MARLRLNSQTARGLMLATLLFVVPTGAGAADTAQALAFASIGQQVAVRETSPMSFGTVERPPESATVELTPFSTTVNCGLSQIGRERALAASIALKGMPNQTFSIAFPQSARMGRAARDIEVASFTHDAGPTPAIDRNGAIQFRIGATLFVSDRTPSGSYTGSFDVIVSNN